MKGLIMQVRLGHMKPQFTRRPISLEIKKSLTKVLAFNRRKWWKPLFTLLSKLLVMKAVLNYNNPSLNRVPAL